MTAEVKALDLALRLAYEMVNDNSFQSPNSAIGECFDASWRLHTCLAQEHGTASKITRVISAKGDHYALLVGATVIDMTITQYNDSQISLSDQPFTVPYVADYSSWFATMEKIFNEKLAPLNDEQLVLATEKDY